MNKQLAPSLLSLSLCLAAPAFSVDTGAVLGGAIGAGVGAAAGSEVGGREGAIIVSAPESTPINSRNNPSILSPTLNTGERYAQQSRIQSPGPLLAATT